MTKSKQKPRKRKKRKKLSKETRAGMGRPAISSKVEIEDLTEHERRFAELVGEGKSPVEAGALLDISAHSQRRYLRECPAVQKIVSDNMDAYLKEAFIKRMDKNLMEFGGSPAIMVYTLDVELRIALHDYLNRLMDEDKLPAGLALQLRQEIDAKIGMVPTTTKKSVEHSKEITTADLLEQMRERGKLSDMEDSIANLRLLKKPDTVRETVTVTEETTN